MSDSQAEPDADLDAGTPTDCAFCSGALAEADVERFLIDVSRWKTSAREQPDQTGPEPVAMCSECRGDCEANAQSLRHELERQDERHSAVIKIGLVVIGLIILRALLSPFLDS